MLPSYQSLVEGLRVLPGVGERTASKLAADILALPSASAERMISAIATARQRIGICQSCFGYSENAVCPLCSDDQRDAAMLCVVTSPLDVWSIERTDKYRGQYHVLGGVLSPVDGVGPSQLNLRELFERLATGIVSNVVFALPATPEAESTAFYIQNSVQRTIRFEQLAYGIPVGGALDYSDARTIGFAFDNRRAL